MRYDYRCDCGEIFEVEHGLGQKPALTCPTCEATVTERVITRTPAINIHWRNPMAASDAMGLKPKHLSPVSNKSLAGG